MRLDEAPGVGPVLATAVVATVADPKSFRSGRNFSEPFGGLEGNQTARRAIFLLRNDWLSFLIGALLW